MADDKRKQIKEMFSKKQQLANQKYATKQAPKNTFRQAVNMRRGTR